MSTKKVLIALTLGLLLIVVTSSAFASMPWANTDYLIAGFDSASIGIFDVNFAFKGLLDDSILNPTGLDFMPDGTLIAGAQTHPTTPGIGSVYNYTPFGLRTHSLSSAKFSNPLDVKSDSSSNIFVATQFNSLGVQRTDLNGSTFQQFGLENYTGVAVLPGGVLWAGRHDLSNTIDVFDITTGTLSGFITLDAGQNHADSMFYSPNTNTVLMTDLSLAVLGTNKVLERDLSGNLIRTFSSTSFVDAGLAGNPSFGVTRGLNNDVFVTTGGGGGAVFQWHSDGTFVGKHTIDGILGPIGIVWAGNANLYVPEPLSALLLLVGITLMGLWRL